MARNPGLKHDSSLWTAEAALPDRPPLAKNEEADVCVVGAGFAGLSTAYLLAKEGQSVVVIDGAVPGGGQSQLTTAHLTAVLDGDLSELAAMHGAAAIKLAVVSHSAAIDRIEMIVDAEAIDCGFERVDGWQFPGEGENARTGLRRQEAAARAASLDCRLETRMPIDGFVSTAALRYPRQGQLHPVRYLAGLARAIEGLGGKIYGGTHAIAVRDGAPARVETRSGVTVTAESVIVATHTPVNDRFRIHTRQYSHRTYVIAARLQRDALPRGLYWDTAEPYHYVRVAPAAWHGEDALIIGGEDHKTGQADDADARFERLLMWARERFPGMREVLTRWSGQVHEPADGLAFIGRNPREKNVYIATGFSGNGTTYGTIAGMLLTDLIMGRPNPWETVYDPMRALTRGAGVWLKENLNGVARYASYLTPGEVSGVEEIPPGGGAVIRRGLGKIAASRDENGQLTEVSAICPHLGGIVCWNTEARTWDCPVHGSRFAADGRVLDGPANTDLPPVPGTRSRKKPKTPRKE